MREAVIVEALRTPIGKRNGKLSGLRPDQLLSQVLVALTHRTGLDPRLVEDVIVGCTTETGEQGNNIARVAATLARFPESVPGTTLNRKCGSSQQALHFAAQGILAGDMEVCIAAGVESMSRVPIGIDRSEVVDAALAEVGLVHQGVSAELIAAQWGLSRGELDEFAFRSHRLAAAATESGAFAKEIIPVTLSDGSIMERDEGIRTDSSREKLAKLPAAFQAAGVITAGNTSQISDGAAAVLVMSRDRAEALGLKPKVRLVARTVVGSDPRMMLTGPMAATRKALDKAGLSLQDIDRFEVNEAFAAVILMWAREMGAPLERVNAWGGAIALGHPTGCSGARLATTLISQMEREHLRYGLQTMCIAGGMATATIYERYE